MPNPGENDIVHNKVLTLNMTLSLIIKKSISIMSIYYIGDYLPVCKQLIQRYSVGYKINIVFIVLSAAFYFYKISS